MPITVIFIILGVVISVLLVILIKKIGSNTNANIIFPSFPPDSGDSDIIPNPAPNPVPNTNQNISQNTSPIAQTTSPIAQNTTPPPPPNTFNLNLFGEGFNSSLLTTPSKLLTLWTNAPNNKIVNTLNLNYDLATGIITGLNLNSNYQLIINLKIYLNGNPLSTTSSFASPNTINFTLGVGITNNTDGSVKKIDDSENKNNQSNNTIINGELSIPSTAGNQTTQAIPYIYMNDTLWINTYKEGLRKSSINLII
jgi:hypothetical protein